MGEVLFPGFGRRTLLETGKIPLEQLAYLALREGQSTAPLYRVHRWFARRLGSQFRGMLAALSLPEEASSRFWERYHGRIPLDGAIALDPFAGGGTAVVEASRCGARVIGFDIDPVATLITRFELAAASRGEPTRAIAAVCQETSSRILPLHTTRVDGEVLPVLHHFWVELRTCPSCATEFEVHPHYRLAQDKDKGLQWVFCRGCHAVHELPLCRKELHCRGICGTRTKIQAGTLRDRKVRCPHCVSESELSYRATEKIVGAGKDPLPPRRRLFAQEYLVPDGKSFKRRFKAVTEADLTLYERASAELQQLESGQGPFAPDREIPAQPRSDRRPLLHGFTHYRQLFNDRQLLHLSLLGQAISELENPEDRTLLGLAYSEHLASNCMYAGYAFGYRRLSPMFSVHAYRHIVRPVELNPWLEGIGRGTFPNALKKVTKGVAFAKAPTDLHVAGGRVPGHGPVGPPDGRVGQSAREVAEGETGAAVKVHDSTDLSELPDESVDLVLTDPPYFDNVCYSELSDFYLAFQQALGIAEPPYDDVSLPAPMALNLAATNRSDETVRGYAEGLRAVLSGCTRVLRRDGVCIFTYHHRSPRAWLCLGEALVGSGLTCTAVLPMRGEGQGGLHTYDGTIKWDAVLVCRKRLDDAAYGEPETSGGRDVLVPEAAIGQAAEAARAYGKRLSGDKRLGFGAPDRVNLYRAHLVSEAEIGTLKEGRVLLERALAGEYLEGVLEDEDSTGNSEKVRDG
jgi:putative DNA methylase